MCSPVFTLPPERHCSDALHDLRAKRVRRAPVVDRGRLVGIVSERRLLSILPGTPEQMDTEAGAHGMDTPVSRVMTTPVLTVAPNDHIEVAAKQMLDHKISGLPVVEHGAVVGIVTESDLFRALVGICRSEGRNRLLLANDSRAEIDVAAICASRGAHVVALMGYADATGPAFVDVGLKSPPEGAVIDALWRAGLKVIEVERGPATSPPAAPARPAALKR